jgi:hypothetical protein
VAELRHGIPAPVSDVLKGGAKANSGFAASDQSIRGDVAGSAPDCWIHGSEPYWPRSVRCPTRSSWKFSSRVRPQNSQEKKLRSGSPAQSPSVVLLAWYVPCCAI